MTHMCISWHVSDYYKYSRILFQGQSCLATDRNCSHWKVQEAAIKTNWKVQEAAIKTKSGPVAYTQEIQCIECMLVSLVSKLQTYNTIHTIHNDTQAIGIICHMLSADASQAYEMIHSCCPSAMTRGSSSLSSSPSPSSSSSSDALSEPSWLLSSGCGRL